MKLAWPLSLCWSHCRFGNWQAGKFLVMDLNWFCSPRAGVSRKSPRICRKLANFREAECLTCEWY